MAAEARLETGGTHQEVAAGTQARDENDLDPGVGDSEGEKWRDSRHLLHRKPRQCAETGLMV